ncbi:uncharacterized protein CBL_00075 [Carabus blaptoides fortunei]
MEVVTASPGGAGNVPPYQRRDVEEWSHLDHLTGMLEHARVETDHWTANTHNTAQKYGKVVDSRDRCAPDGTQHQRKRRQLEVFQAHVPGGSLQVIRTQTVATSGSRWSSRSTTAQPNHQQQQTTSYTNEKRLGQPHDFENLQLALNPLDLSSQKTKASVGRSGSIGGRRPPSRPRSIVGRTDDDVTARLQRVSQLCQQLHDKSLSTSPSTQLAADRPSLFDRRNGDGNISDHFETESIPSNHSDESELRIGNGIYHSKSPSPTVDFHKSVYEKNEQNGSTLLEQIEDWRRSNSNRQFPKQNVMSNKLSSIADRKLKTDLDTDRRLNTALRGNNVDLEALDQILKSISSSTSSTYSDKKGLSETNEEPERDNSDRVKGNLSKRHSFITVESLQEVRGRLRRLSSPTDDLYRPIDLRKEEEPDDGIVAEDSLAMKKEEHTMPASNAAVSRVKSYVYGMEAMMQNKKPISGTGSLESRTSNKSNGSSSNRSEDWYNRRKSYGFEQVHNQQIDQSNSISLRGKNKIESSTDSGICRSTEIVVVPQVLKSSQNYSTQSTDKSDSNDEATKYNAHKVTTTYNKIGNSTVISLGGELTNGHNGVSVNNDNSRVYPKQENELFTVWNRRAMLNSSQETQLDNNKLIKNDSEQIKITIPIVSEDSVTNANGRRIYHRQMSDGTSVSVESSWSNNKQSNGGNHDIKRHSIAVDESKYVTRNDENKYQGTPYRRTSLAIADNDAAIALMMDAEDDEGANLGKRHKKVEFSKTEVHFAAESGRVNIVETDEKPPPTQNFRRRRRNSSITSNHVPEDYNKNGLPLIHFGDTSYEKKLFGVSDQENGIQVQVDAADTFNRDTNPYLNGVAQDNVICNNTVTVSSVTVGQEYEPESKENHENENQPRGILKNRMIKPKPYLLGDDNNEILSRDTSNDEQEGSIWGVRLKPVNKTEESSPIWRSTVTVQNTSYNVPVSRENNCENEHEIANNYDAKHYGSEEVKPEFQMLLNSLRPARKSEPAIVPPECSVEQQQQRTSPMLDPRRSSWSVADKVKQVEDLRFTENKGYSTKVHFGGGEATVVENVDLPKHTERHTTWPRQEETHNRDEKKQSSVINKGLVVRIGREDSNHTVCSKTTTNHNSNSTTTTTKITIEMSPSPTNVDNYPMFSSIKLPRASLHNCLKSTSLIMNTFTKVQECTRNHKATTASTTFNSTGTTVGTTNSELPAAIPDQLAALRKLYDEAAEHSDDSEKADEEVRSYMSGGGGGDDSDVVRETEDDVSSVVSGSWSKMRAFRNIKQHLQNIHNDTSRQKESEMFRNIINRHTYTKKDFSAVKPTTYQPNIQKKTQEPVVNSRYEKHAATESKVSVRNNSFDRKPSDASLTDSPRTERRPLNGAKKTYEPVRTQYTNGHLSSPSLVGSSIQKPPRSYQSRRTETMVNHSSKMDEKKFTSDKDERTSAFSKITASHVKDSPSLARKNLVRKTPLPYTNSHSAYTRRNDLLTKKTEAPSNYYSEIQSPKPTKKLNEKSRDQKHWKENKPDLLQHFSDTREYVNLSTVIREDSKNTVTSASNKSKSANIKKVSSTKKSSRIDSPSVERAESPIYENIDEVITSLAGMEKESAILQELTKAADQILQAVNGYTDEDSMKHSTDDEEDGKKHRIKNFRKTGEVLSTISETKSWKQVQTSKQKQVDTSRNIKSRVRPTSSTSSIESIARESKPLPPVRQNRASKLQEDKTKKKISGSNTELSKATRARRLQRANSREALLQSHGSSSEDISNSLEVTRKPRLVRRTKTQSGSEEVNSVTRRTHVSQTNVSRRRECDMRKSVDSRVPGLQEIRHKTAISTIKSTAEKNASREKAMKLKSDDLRKRTSAKRDTSISKGSNMMMSAHQNGGRSVTGRGGTGGTGGGGVGGVGGGGDPMAGVTAMAVVRTSSGVPIRRSNRTDRIIKH